MRYRAAALLFAAGLACSQPRAEPAAVPGPAVQGPSASGAVAELATPLLGRLREQVQTVVAPMPPPRVQQDLAGCAVKLIVRWEVTSEAVYTRRYAGVIWPGGESGPTWGLGFDGGHQTRATIRSDWNAHPDVDRLATSAGVVGPSARTRVRAGEWANIFTPFRYASDVFIATSLPSYVAQARRAFGPGFDTLPVGAQCGLVSLVYNRGGAMQGSRNTEKRAIRSDCIPTQDLACIARELRAMCRLWAATPNGPGLCARREDEARTVLSLQ